MAEALPASSAKRIKVPPKYEPIMRWLIANPEKSIQEGARQFGVSPGWFSTVINSDLFIARYQELLAELDVAGGLQKLAERIVGAANLAVEKVASTLENTTDPEVVLRAAGLLLRATKPQAPSTVVNNPVQNVFQLDPRLAAIQESRAKAIEAAKGHARPIMDLIEVAVPNPNASPNTSGVMLDRLGSVPPPQQVEFIMPDPPSPLKAFDD